MATSHQEAVAADKRVAILEAAQGVFAERGFHEATVEEIAERAGIGKGTVYLYFESKKDLLVSLVVQKLSELEERVATGIDGLDRPNDVLRRLVDVFVDFHVRNRDFLTFLLGNLGSLGEGLEQRTREVRERLAERVSAVLQQHGRLTGQYLDSDLVAHAFLGLVNVVALRWLCARSDLSREQVVEQAVLMCQAGLI